MIDGEGWICQRCGEWHHELPFAYGSDAPAYWSPELEGEPGCVLGEEQCVIGGEDFFVRGRICVPVEGAELPFEWGVWVSLSEKSFMRMNDLWEAVGREHEPPMFGWLSSELPMYPPTLSLKTTVRWRPVGERPLIELEPSEHPLAIEQHEGIDLARVQQFAEALLHG